MFYLYKPGKNEGWIFCFRARQSVFHVDEPAMKSETVSCCQVGPNEFEFYVFQLADSDTDPCF